MPSPGGALRLGFTVTSFGMKIIPSLKLLFQLRSEAKAGLFIFLFSYQRVCICFSAINHRMFKTKK